VKVTAADFMLDSPERRKGSNPPHRRALVHNESDGLTVNFNEDYPGGIILNGVAEISPHFDPGGGTGTAKTPLKADGPLVIRGDISFQTPKQLVVGGGDPGGKTLSLSKELKTLQEQISKLTTRVAALEAKK
jgi:hypothetical protein